MRSYSLEDYNEHRENYIGVCTKCGAERECCEPDASGYECEECGELAVEGADNLLMSNFYSVDREDNEYEE